MIKRADASRISREKATKEQIAENFKRLAVDTDKKVQLKPSLLKIQKTLDGNTFGIIHENKTYYLKYTTKKGSTNPTDYKHLDGLNATFGIEKFNSFEKATNKMSFICEAQNNAHKLRLLLEKDGEDEKVTSDDTEAKLLGDLDKEKEAPAADATATPETPAEPAATPEAPVAPEGGEETTPVDTTQTGTETPKEMADDILGSINEPDAETAAPEGSADVPAADAATTPEEPAADTTATPEAPAEDADPKKAFQEAVGKLGQTINELQDNDQFDEKDIKNAMNSLISAIGPEGFKLVGDKVIESFYKKMQGSEISTDDTEEETSTEEPATEEPATEEEGTEKLDENFLKQLKIESKRLLKEQLQQEIEKRKRKILIESIKRKLV